VTFGVAAPYLPGMKAWACAAVLGACALGMSACAGGHSGRSATTGDTKTDAIQLHESNYNSLSPQLQNFVRSMLKSNAPGRLNEIDVYGPGSRAALVKASSGDVVAESNKEQKERFYLIVLHGHFVCDSCSGPAGATPPHGTIETRVWSAAEGGTDVGISSSLPAAMSQLHRLATLTIS
jgi:hypothetical protein